MQYYWKCQYNDETEISSKDGYKYKDIDRTKLEKFVLLNLDNDKVVLVLNMRKYAQLICRMRTAMPVMDGDKMTIWIVGYHETIDLGTRSVSKQTVCFVFPDGTIEIADKFDKNHKWQYPINFLPEEM